MTPNPSGLGNDIDCVIKAIRDAWYGGRRIVPILGAGLSADSGIPVISSLNRYFGKLKSYLKARVYLPPPPRRGASPADRERADLFADRARSYDEEPWRYVTEVGWPDRFDLNQELLASLEQTHPGDKRPLVSDAEGEGRRDILAAIDAKLSGEFSDWRRMIQYFTRYQGDLADVLFHRLCAGRRPNLGHRYVAFLVKLLSVRTVYTYNFDDLIERALRWEGVEHQTFAMEHGGGLPHPQLTRDVMAVVKLHGSSHSLLLDQRIEHPLADSYKQRFVELTGSQPLLLVVGCSGDDGRLLDLLEYAAAEGAASVAWIHFEKPHMPGSVAGLRARIERRGRAGDPRTRATLITAPTNNVGQTLQHIYGALTGRRPASLVPYSSQQAGPFPLGRAPAPEDCYVKATAGSPFCLLHSLGGEHRGERHIASTAAEVLLDLAAHWTSKGFQVIWVDLEAIHTFSAVVGSIIAQCAVFDATLAPSVMPTAEFDGGGSGDASIESAVGRVTDALRRHRYVVILDGLEAYLWPPTAHHGETTVVLSRGATRLEPLQTFLTRLATDGGHLGESRVLVGIDQSRPRTPSTGEATEGSKYVSFHKQLTASGVWVSTPIDTAAESRPFSDLFIPPFDGTAPVPFCVPKAGWSDLCSETVPSAETWGLVLLLFSTVRRPRSVVMVRQLLFPVFERIPVLDAVVKALTSDGASAATGMIRLEGGAIWCCRAMRDYAYSQNTGRVGKKKTDQIFLPGTLPPSGDPARRQAAAQAFTMAFTHYRVGRTYYAVDFVQSQDATSFLEYVYHSVSSIRYYARLLALLAGTDVPANPAAVEGMVDAVAAINKCLTESGRELWWEHLPQDQPLTLLAMGDGGPIRDSGAIVESLGRRHAREIGALWKAWVRAEPQLRTQLPAEQLLFWCDALLNDDIPHRLNKVPFGEGWFEGGTVESAESEVTMFEEVIRDFSVKLHFERSDYLSAAKIRLQSLARDAGPEDGMADSEVSVETIRQLFERLGQSGRRRIRHVHYALDAVACLLKISHDQRDPGLENHNPARAVGDLLAAIEKAIEHPAVADEGDPADRKAALDGDDHEAKLRTCYLRAEACLEHVSVFARPEGYLGTTGHRDGAPPRRSAGAGNALTPARADGREVQPSDRPLPDNGTDAAIRHIDTGLAYVRGQPPRADGRLRSLILDPVVGGSLYIPYRSALLSVRGRLKWLRDAESPAAGDGVLDDSFENAFRSFEMARGGLGNTNHQIAALNELYRVEACLARARIALAPERAIDDSGLPALMCTRAKFESARDGLQRARAHLMTGRRNVIWWKLFYALAAQYHADRLAASVVYLLRDWPRKGERFLSGYVRPGEVHARLRRGYSALRSALDLKQSEPEPTAPWSWLGRAWWEMTAAAVTVGHLIVLHLGTRGDGRVRRDAGERSERDTYLRHLVGHLSVSSRLWQTSPADGDFAAVDCKALFAGCTDHPADWVSGRMATLEDDPGGIPAAEISPVNYRLELLVAARSAFASS